MTEQDRIAGELPFKCWRSLPLADRKKLDKFTDYLLEREAGKEMKNKSAKDLTWGRGRGIMGRDDYNA